MHWGGHFSFFPLIGSSWPLTLKRLFELSRRPSRVPNLAYISGFFFTDFCYSRRSRFFFCKLKIFSLNSSEFHILTKKSGLLGKFWFKNSDIQQKFSSKLKDFLPTLKNPGNPFAGNEKKSVKNKPELIEWQFSVHVSSPPSMMDTFERKGIECRVQ